MYYAGLGVKQSYSEAAYWYRLAAKQGDSDAQYKLGCLYYYDCAESVSEDEAIMYYCLSASQGNEDAQADLVDLITEGDCEVLSTMVRIAKYESDWALECLVDVATDGNSEVLSELIH